MLCALLSHCRWVQATVLAWTGRSRLLDPCTGAASSTDYSSASAAPVPQYACNVNAATDTTAFPWGGGLLGAWETGELGFCIDASASGYSTSVSPADDVNGAVGHGGVISPAAVVLGMAVTMVLRK